MQKVLIDTEKCLEIAEYTRDIAGGVPEDREDPMPYNFPPHVAHNGWCATVAINQQTTPVVGKALRGSVRGTELRGWDYLLQKSIDVSMRDPDMFTVRWLLGVTGEKVRALYRDEKEGETLNQTDVRAELLVNLGELLAENHWESVHAMYLQAEGYLVRSDGKGIAQVLSQARAYQDPVQKKLFHFLAIMRNQKLWEYGDPFNVSSPVNYHEQRGHLRLGTVLILDVALLQKIRARENITAQEDIEIRFAVRRAIEFMAQYLSVTPSAMHYYFWNHIRNCCSRDNPHCAGCGEGCKLPDRYRLTESKRCVFVPVCSSAMLPVEKMVIEPRIDDTIWQ